MTTIKASVATPASDRRLVQRERKRGAAARGRNEARETCPWTSGMLREAWLAGFDNPLLAHPIRAA